MEFSDLSFQFLFLNGVFKEKTIGNPATPLHEAARRGDLKMCEILLNYKSDPCLMDAKNHAAIHLAAFGVGFKIMWYKISCGYFSCISDRDFEPISGTILLLCPC